jgi:hypothetical protein
MDRRRLVIASSTSGALSASTSLGQGVGGERARTRTAQAEYVGALTIMRRHADWVLEEVTTLLDAEDRDDEEWRIDVLAPFGAVEALRASGRSLVPPGKYEDGHDHWLDCVDELEDAGAHLRTGVLEDVDRSVDLAQQALDRARDRLAEVDAEIPRRVGRTISATAGHSDRRHGSGAHLRVELGRVRKLVSGVV